MDKKKQQLVITGALLIVMAVMLARVLFFSKSGAARKTAAGASQTVDAQLIAANMTFLVSVRQSEAQWIQQEDEWKKPWGKDPFGEAGVTFELGGPSSFSLSGIVWDEKMPVAIVNDKLLQTGDLIDGCQVKTIFKSSVSLSCDDKIFELKLFKPEETKNAPEALKES